jgi:hypothetical protein
MRIAFRGQDRMSVRWLCAFFACCFLLASAIPTAAEDPPRQRDTSSQANPEIELNLIALPTTLSIRKHHGYFRLTHRFSRDLTLGDFGDLANDLFALDNGAVIGLEYRFAVEDNIHVGIHRSTLNKTLQLFSRWDAVRQDHGLPFGLSGFASFEALDNLQDGHQPGIGGVVSRTWGNVLALYASPTFVYGTFDADRIAEALIGHDHDHKTAGTAPDTQDDEDHSGHKATFYVGLGGRLRVRPSVFVVGEYTPRITGHDPGDAMWGVAIEKLTRGHTLQVNITNSFATTPGQIARGGLPGVIYLGFNVTRKF